MTTEEKKRLILEAVTHLRCSQSPYAIVQYEDCEGTMHGITSIMNWARNTAHQMSTGSQQRIFYPGSMYKACTKEHVWITFQQAIEDIERLAKEGRNLDLFIDFIPISFTEPEAE